MTPPSLWDRVRCFFTGALSAPRCHASTTTVSSEADVHLDRPIVPADPVQPSEDPAIPATTRAVREAGDLYAMNDAVFEHYLAQERARDAQYEPTTKALPRSRLLSRAAEAEVIEVDEAGLPNVHLARVNGQLVLVVPDGRFVDRKHTTLYRHDVFVVAVRGTSYYEAANLATQTSAGTRLGLRREPDNEHDQNAIAVIDLGGGEQLGWVNKQNAKRLAKRLDSGEELVVLSLCGSPEHKFGDALVVLITRPDILTHLHRQTSRVHDISHEANVKQEWVRTDPDVRAEDRWEAGTPPVHGLSRHHERAPEVANIRTSQSLQVERADTRWLVIDNSGLVLGQLRWRAGDAQRLNYPERGVLHVTRLFLENDIVVDFGGYVVPQ